jgi:hypothetical protein
VLYIRALHRFAGVWPLTQGRELPEAAAVESSCIAAQQAMCFITFSCCAAAHSVLVAVCERGQGRGSTSLPESISDRSNWLFQVLPLELVGKERLFAGPLLLLEA